MLQEHCGHKYNNYPEITIFVAMFLENFDLVIIGGGAAGMMAAATAADTGKSVIVVEKNEALGRKLLLTGKGRCNITNMREWEEFSRHVHPDSAFFKPAFYSFSNKDVVEYFNRLGLPTVVERGDRVYPASGRSHDVRDVLHNHIRDARNVSVLFNSTALGIYREPNGVFIVNVDNEVNLYTNNVLVCTGGLSYPRTGSTGDGYRYAKSLGHTLVPRYPSLTALKVQRYDQMLVGLTLKNISLTLYIEGNPAQTEFGEVTFTNCGVEGALGFRVSRKAVQALEEGKKVELLFDLKPALTSQQLKQRVEQTYRKGLTVERVLEEFLPLQAILPFVHMSENLTVQSIPVKLKSWKMRVVDYVGYERCVITAGGVNLKEISRKTMESKKVPGLYFAGEVLDLDADTGGYNLQIAFSTAVLAARSALGM